MCRCVAPVHFVLRSGYWLWDGVWQLHWWMKTMVFRLIVKLVQPWMEQVSSCHASALSCVLTGGIYCDVCGWAPTFMMGFRIFLLLVLVVTVPVWARGSVGSKGYLDVTSLWSMSRGTQISTFIPSRLCPAFILNLCFSSIFYDALTFTQLRAWSYSQVMFMPFCVACAFNRLKRWQDSEVVTNGPNVIIGYFNKYYIWQEQLCRTNYSFSKLGFNQPANSHPRPTMMIHHDLWSDDSMAQVLYPNRSHLFTVLYLCAHSDTLPSLDRESSSYFYSDVTRDSACLSCHSVEL